MNNKIINLEEMKPHISIEGVKSVHVCPVSMFESLENGSLKAEDIEEFDDFLPTIIKEWRAGLL